MLREILDDPGLHLYWWDWERRRYVDVGGVSSRSRAGPRAMVTPIEYERGRSAPCCTAAPARGTAVHGSFVPMIRIAMERDRLHRDLVAKLEQLRASRCASCGRGRGAAAPRAEPARRCPAAAHGVAVPAPALRQKAGGDQELVALVDGALASRGRDRRPARAGTRPAPAALQREGLAAALQRGRNRSTVPSCRSPDRPAASAGARGGGVLRLRRGGHQHGQARAVPPGVAQRRARQRDAHRGRARRRGRRRCVECGEEQATGPRRAARTASRRSAAMLRSRARRRGNAAHGDLPAALAPRHSDPFTVLA